MSIATTHIETEKQFIPALRFAGDTESWKEQKIGAFANVRSGYTFSRDYQGLKNEKWLYLKVADIGIKSNIKYLKKAINTISEETLNKMKAKPFRKGCTVFPRVGAALLNNNKRLLFVDSLVDDNVLAIDIFNVEKCDDEFIFYWFLTKHLSDFCNNGQIPVISATRVKSFYVPIPGKIEQQKIASFLSAVDEKIQQLTKKKKLLEQYKKGVMQQLFSGQLRFKDDNGNPYPDWEEKQLGEVGKTFNGLTGKTKEDFGEGKPYIQYMQIFRGSKIDPDEFGFVKLNENEKQSRAQFGDAFFTTSSETPKEIGTASVLLDEIEELYLNSFCFGYRPNNLEILIPKFLQFLLRSEIFRKKIIPLAQGSTRYNMSKVQLMKLIVAIPFPEEQQKIANYLSLIDTKIEAVNNQITQTQTFKKGLLQQMFVAA